MPDALRKIDAAVDPVPLLKLCFRQRRNNQPLVDLTRNQLRVRLLDAMHGIKAQLQRNGNGHARPELNEIIDPVDFFRALDADGIDLSEIIGEHRVAELEAYEERKRAKRSLRETTRARINAQIPTLRFLKDRPGRRSISELPSVTLYRRLLNTTKSIRDRFYKSTNADAQTVWEQIKDRTHPVDFFRSLEAHGFNLEQTIGAYHLAELQTYERKRQEKRCGKRDVRPIEELTTNELRRRLSQVMRRLKIRLDKDGHTDKKAALEAIKKPADFFRALEAQGLNIGEIIGEHNMKRLEEYERRKRERQSIKSSTRRCVADAAPVLALQWRTRANARPIAEIDNKNLDAQLRKVMIRVKRHLGVFVAEPDKRNALHPIVNPVDFFRALEAHGIDLRKAIGEPRLKKLEEYEARKVKRGLSPLRAPNQYDRALDQLQLEKEREESATASNGEIGPYQAFLLFWNKMRQIPPLTQQEEYDLFEKYETGKRNTINTLSFERRAMRALLALCVPHVLYQRHEDNRYAGVQFGFQFYTSSSPDFEEIDPFMLLHGEERAVDNTLERWLKIEVEHADEKLFEEEDDEEPDGEIIDFATKWPEICRFIRQHGILYLREFRKIESALDRLPFRRQGAFTKETILQRIEQTWKESSRAENPDETLYSALKSFLPEHIAKNIAACLAAAEEPRKSIVDLFMKIRPNPDLIRALFHFSSDEEGIKVEVDELLKTKQKILAPHLRNVCFTARPLITRGAHPFICIESGTFGLMRAADVFDYRGEQRFYDYCWRHIWSAISRGLYRENNAISLPLNRVPENIKRVEKASRLSALKFGDASPKHIAEIAEMAVAEVEETLGYMRLNQHTSFETPNSDDGDGRAMEDSLETATTETPEDILLAGEALRMKIEDILRKAELTLSEEDVVRKRFLSRQESTLEQVGKTRHVTRERIRQIEKKALKKLKIYMKEEGLAAEDFS